MATLLRVFDTNYGKIRGIVCNNMMHWHGNDIVKGLGYTDLRVLNDCVDTDDTIKVDVPEKEVLDKNTETTLINNFGVQSLVSAIPMNLGRVSGRVDVKLFKKTLRDIENACRKNAISDEDKAILDIYHAGTVEEKANSLVAYKNIIQGKMKTSNNNEGVQLQFEDIKNSEKTYTRNEVKKILGIQSGRLHEFMFENGLLNEINGKKYPTEKALKQGYCVKCSGVSSFKITQKLFDKIKDNLSEPKKDKRFYPFKAEKDLTGNTYGRLTVIEMARKEDWTDPRNSHWVCKCRCGNTSIVRRNNLLSGHTISCGNCNNKF